MVAAKLKQHAGVSLAGFDATLTLHIGTYGLVATLPWRSKVLKHRAES